MIEPRAEALAARLEKGRLKTREVFEALTREQWLTILYPQPVWRVRDLLAHFVSAERHLLGLAQSVAEGGEGVPAGFDFDLFNAQEQKRLSGIAPDVLMNWLEEERQKTIRWTRSLNGEQLDRVGRHPALGEISVEAMLTAIYGHQLMHMRDLMRQMGSVV